MLSDEAIVDVLRRETAWRLLDPRKSSRLDYRLTDVRVRDGHVLDVRITQRDGESARLLIRMPASGSPQYWVYARPEDATDWVGQLLTWIDEEVFTDGLGTGRLREDHGGESYVVVANYGWHQTDTEEHARLTAAAGPRGWHGSGSV
ncbi:hypothetical protein [Curtobacterium sp. PhB78]|uniref:hypothetical protein n=1 Tax=Curtobacterium sp. PhB78 TaxID=2485102 RepID=UPI000F48CB7C|nr:hypothetical protein [Curtobacterium sp. PhB78]ROS46991.1 hypothetical protein EDF53_0006 [Curtobacterium sp. PhB78]